MTANRRAENLQNVPITVEAVSGAALINAGVTNIQDIKNVVAGATFISNSGFIKGFIRGIGSTSPGPSIEPQIAIYVDGVYYASTAGANLDFIDVSQVEVLKGPQGTLFGRNATGGLIQVTTKDPTSTPHVDVDFGFDNYETAKSHLYVAGALAQNLVASFSAEGAEQGDGYGTNFYNGKDVYKVDSDLALRSKLLWTPVSGTRVTTILDYSQTRNSDSAFRIAPGSLPTPPTGPAYGGSPWDTDSNLQPLDFVKTGGASIKAEQSLPFANLSDIIAYRQTFNLDDFDHDATATAYQGFIVPQAEHQFSNELQLQSLRSSRVQWTGGIYYFYLYGAAPGLDVDLGNTKATNASFPITTVAQNAKQIVHSAAGYGQATIPLFAQTNLTVGARYTYERHELTGIETGDSGQEVLRTLASVNEAKNFYRPTFRVALDHRFTDQLLAYASFNTGFKSGGYNPDTVTNPVFYPETLDAYEAGLKTDFFQHRLRADLSAFYYDYKDIQVQDVGSRLTTEVVNAGGAHLDGADLDVQAQVTPDFHLNAGFEYLHAHFTSYADAPLGSALGLTPVVPGSAAGNALPYSPTGVLNIGADYIVHDVFHGDVDLSATYNYNSGYFFEADNDIHQPNFSQLNTSIRWKSQDAHYTFSLYSNNITDAVVSSLVATNTFGSHLQLFNPPRTYGFVVGYHY